MKVIPMEYATDDQRNTYGILFESAMVYEVIGQRNNTYAPHRFKVWSNANRMVNLPGGKYEDPLGKLTNELTSYTLPAEASVIARHGNGTGSVLSGQVWSPEFVAVGDVVKLVTPAGFDYPPLLITLPRFGNVRLEVFLPQDDTEANVHTALG